MSFIFKGVIFLNVIEVEIKNKKAVRTNETAYVCDNSDFTVVFSFDEEWNEFDIKTARFAYDDKYQDIVFTGSECPMPIISNTKLISVGVFAGDLHTTTPAVVVANKSILGASGTPEPPSEDVYAQIIKLIEEIEVGGEVDEEVIRQAVEEYLNNNPIIIPDETDPTVPEWAKKSTKPTYTASEVGAYTKMETKEYVDEQTEIIKSDIDGLQKQLNEEAHFRGYLSTNAKIQALEATPNDFAYSAESGTKWVYDAENGWQDTGTPVPDQLTPASDATPLVNGTPTAGQSEEYARGDHRHPTDTTRLGVEAFNEFKSDLETAFDTIIDIQNELMGVSE